MAYLSSELSKIIAYSLVAIEGRLLNNRRHLAKEA